MSPKDLARRRQATIALTVSLMVSGFAMAPFATAAPSKPKVTVVSFVGPNGSQPSGSPNCYPASQTFNGKAACFGSTYVGGNFGYGSIYKTGPDGSNPRVIYSFNVFQGLMPSQSVVLGPDGATLYGATSQGGASGSGEVFAYNMQTRTITRLASFTGPGGSTPQGPPIIVNGTLFGLAGQGGANGYGVIYAQPLSGGPMQILHNFAGGTTDTATPFGSLLFNPADGLLYGVGFAGTQGQMGGIFSISPDGTNYQLRATFTPATGGVVQMGALVLGPSGLMYGNGWVGGANQLGTIFTFNPGTNALSTLFNYTTQTGTQPYNSLLISPSGKWLYTITWQGGKNKAGTILAVAIDGSSSRVLLDLDLAKTGGVTFANPTLALKGNRLLAAMSQGGKANTGTLLTLTLPAAYR